MSVVGNKRVAPARRPSPSREDAGMTEKTFQQKLDEIKKLRMSSSSKPEECHPPPLPTSDVKLEPNVVPKTVKTINGYKTFLKSHGDWVEVVSKSGKVYYYNKRTLVNQWKKPEDWLKEEERLNNPPSPPPLPPDDPEPENPPLPEDDSKLKLKLMTMKKIQKRLKNPEAHLPLAYQKNQKRLDDSDNEDGEAKKPKLTVENAFEDPDEAEDDQKLVKLDPEDEIGHLKAEYVEEESSEPVENTTNAIQSETANNPDDSAIVKKDPKDCRKFDPRISGPERAENLVEGCAAALAFKNITNTNIVPEVPDNNLASGAGNSTYFTEYNLPCCLRRCKFPKEQVL